ncbi:hypothetical protein Golomagni_06390, partial [Golovinomyces magnicellulatus]
MLSGSRSISRGASPGTRRRVSKLRKKRHDESLDIPEQLRGSDEEEEEESSDVMSDGQGPPFAMNMGQSIVGLIAGAAEKIDFHDRFYDSSSDEEGKGKPETKTEDLSQTTILPSPKKKKKQESSSHRRRISGHKLLKSLPALPKLRSKSKSAPNQLSPNPDEDPSEGADIPSPPAIKLTRSQTTGVPPVMSRMLEARAELSERPSFDLERHESRTSLDSGVSPLEKRLMEIFEFDEPEEVLDEFPCWLLQSVLLQGYLYITAKHVCFYAYLPKKANVVAKSGFLSKSGKRNPAYNRYWFRLKGDILSYYRDSANLYFPHGQIDLRFGISASITDRDKDGLHFSIVTSTRTYNFRADSAPSAKEWVKSLQRVIFRSLNDGDSVKISLPIENIIDVEDTQMIEFSDTCKIRVIDNDETYAIDEYFFSFFSLGKEAINVLKILVEDSNSRDPTLGKILGSPGRGGSDAQPSPAQSETPNKASLTIEHPSTTKRQDQVKATLSPMSPHSANPSPRGSMDVPSRSSIDGFRPFGRTSHDSPRAMSSVMKAGSPRRSFSGSRSRSRRRFEEKKLPSKLESSESNLRSSTDNPSSVSFMESGTEDPSASQILKGSDAFQSPTVLQAESSMHLPKPQAPI